LIVGYIITIMSLIIAGKKIEVPGLVVHDWQTGPSWIKEITDFYPRSHPVHLIICHTHKGKVGKLLPGMGPGSSVASALVRYQTNTARSVSWDYTIDTNGEVFCQNDPTKKVSWQAGSVNGISLGFEMVQLESGELYEGQIEKVVLLIDALTLELGIQRQICWDKAHNKPKITVCPRLASGGDDVVGIAGHRNQTNNRGPGDPGDHIFFALQRAGYECFDLTIGEDLQVWKDRQKSLGIRADGVPGPNTLAALKAAGHKNGLWVKRPVDDLLKP